MGEEDVEGVEGRRRRGRGRVAAAPSALCGPCEPSEASEPSDKSSAPSRPVDAALALRIEALVKYVARHAEMEQYVRTQQAGNAAFDFLREGGVGAAWWRHLRDAALREQRVTPPSWSSTDAKRQRV